MEVSRGRATGSQTEPGGLCNVKVSAVQTVNQFARFFPSLRQVRLVPNYGGSLSSRKATCKFSHSKHAYNSSAFFLSSFFSDSSFTPLTRKLTVLWKLLAPRTDQPPPSHHTSLRAMG